MAEAVLESGSLERQPDTAEEADLSGRRHMARSVLSSWGGHFVFVVAGFIMPRFIDRHIGQTALGVWDFGWSLVSYFSLAQAGIGSSVNRYVAKYRATGDTAGMNRMVSTVTCIQLLVTVLVVLLTAAATWAVPVWWSERLGTYVGEARWVVMLLGLSLAVQMACDPFNGLITGCHRWDLHNGLNAGFYAATVAGMMVALSLGYGLRGLALANFFGVAATEAARAMLAHRVCPGLRIRLSSANRSDARQIMAFGGKTLVHAVGRLLLYQTNSLIVVSYLGPAVLALYSRPSSLVKQANTFVNKFAFVITPSASSLYAKGRHAELRSLLVEATRFGAYISLPMILLLSIFGDQILSVWMGSTYRQGLVLAILAVGHLVPMIEQPVIMVLAGMNAHGRPGLVNLIAAVVALVLSLVTVGWLHWGMTGAALSIAVPLALANGLYVPAFACRTLGMPLGKYLADSLGGPLLCAVPFGIVLVVCRITFAGRPLLALICGGLAGAAVLVPLYWRHVLPASIKQKLTWPGFRVRTETA